MRTGKARRKWPNAVARDAPTLHSITEAIYSDIDAEKKQYHSSGTFDFPATVLEVHAPDTPPKKRLKTAVDFKTPEHS
jgi:hypothetical protein